MGKYSVEKVEAYLDTFDSNALQLYLPSTDFVISICTYLENDDEIDAPQFSLGGESDRKVGEIERVTIGKSSITLDFSSPFKNGDQHLEFEFPDPINPKMIDFVVNKLFLGDFVAYEDDVGESLRIEQSEFREEL